MNESSSINSTTTPSKQTSSTKEQNLAQGQWVGCLTFTEWQNTVVLHVICLDPLLMAGSQARELVTTALKMPNDIDTSLPDKFLSDIMNWLPYQSTSKAVTYQLQFSRDTSINMVHLKNSK